MKSDTEFYARCDKALASRFPIFGKRRARSAVQQLIPRIAEPAALDRILVAAVHPDRETSEAAGTALRSLQSPSRAVDALCAVWAKGRNALLGRLIEECKYLAQQPLEVWVLSALQAGFRPEATTPEVVAILLGVFGDRDAKLRSAADATLRALQPGPGMDALCAQATAGNEIAARICIERGFRPADPQDTAVFLAANGQFDAYFNEHDGLGDLRAGYERAGDPVKARIMAAARTGDARLTEFVLRPRQGLRQCSDAEITDALRSHIHREDWPRLFADCRLLPLRHSLDGWHALARSGWQAPDAHDADLLKRVASELDGGDAPPVPPAPPKGASAVFEGWLSAGRQEGPSQSDEDGLVRRFQQADPPEAVPLVSALATRQNLTETTRELVKNSPHWLIRLAGHITGIARGADLESVAGKDRCFWVRELAGTDAVWTFWPEDATPAHLKKLGTAPREATLGNGGRARRLLHAVLIHGLTGFELEKDIVAPDEGAIEITRIEKQPRKN